MTELIIQDTPLKNVFRIFNRNETLHIIELGDTWHPSCGFVDETHFKNIKTVEGLLNTDYDFRGLVIFKATINKLLIEYENGSFKITGNPKDLEKIKLKFQRAE